MDKPNKDKKKKLEQLRLSSPYGEAGNVKEVRTESYSGKAGRVDPKQPGVVYVADSPDVAGAEAIPGFKQYLVDHESGHLAKGDKLHEEGNRVRLSRGHGQAFGPTPELAAKEMEAMRVDSKRGGTFSERFFAEMERQAREDTARRAGPLGLLEKAKDALIKDVKDNSTASEWLKKRTGRD